MKLKKNAWLGACAFIFLFSGGFVQACSQGISMSSIQCTIRPEFLAPQTCLDENCISTANFNGSEGTISGPEFDGYYFRYSTNTIYFRNRSDRSELAANQISKLCAEDTQDIQKILLDGKPIGTVEPYSAEKVAELERGKNEIEFNKCRYTDYSLSTSKNWIFIGERYTSYCDAWFDPSCGGSAPNITNYSIALASHPDQINGNKIIPLIGPILPIFVIAGLFSMKGSTPVRKKWLAAIKPTKRKILTVIILSIILFLATLVIVPRIDLLGTLGMGAWMYLILSIIQYFRTK